MARVAGHGRELYAERDEGLVSIVITDIPNPEDYDNSASGLLNTAWETGVNFLIMLEDSRFEEWGGKEDLLDFWKASQIRLENAFSMIQQAQEMALKGRICTVSPYLLISNDFRDWPKQTQREDTPFFEFRSPNAADLIRLHNSVSPDRLQDSFTTLYNDVRRKRNVIQHHGSLRETLQTADILRLVLDSYSHLFPDHPWAIVRRNYVKNSPSGVLFGFETIFDILQRELNVVIEHLSQKEVGDHYWCNKRRKWYLCPNCMEEMKVHNNVLSAQLSPNTPESIKVFCPVCWEHSSVIRKRTKCHSCKSNVFDDNDTCLHCGAYGPSHPHA